MNTSITHKNIKFLGSKEPKHTFLSILKCVMYSGTIFYCGASGPWLSFFECSSLTLLKFRKALKEELDAYFLE